MRNDHVVARRTKTEKSAYTRGKVEKDGNGLRLAVTGQNEDRRVGKTERETIGWIPINILLPVKLPHFVILLRRYQRP